MPMSNFPNGFNSGVSIRGVPILSSHSGEVFWVDSNSAYSGDGTFTRPFLTIDTAINNCTANRGSIVMVKAGHAETLATASAITCDIAGVSIIGLGSGADRPTLTFSAVDATVVISAASVTVQNIITKPSIDSVVSPIVVSGADCWLDIEHQDASAAIEAVAAILTAAGADRLHVDLKYRGFIAGNACVNAIRLVGVDTGDINVDFYGVASTSIVEFHTTACHNITVTGEFYNSGTTNLTKDVVDTVTGSTWNASGFDGAAGQSFSGGSGAALAGDDVGAVASAVATLQAEVSGAAGLTTFPAGAAAANSVSLAEVLRYIQENIIVGTGTALPSNQSLYDLLAGTNGVATFPAGAAAGNAVSMAEVLRYVQENIITGTGTALPTNQSIYDLLAGANGIATFPAAAAPANGVSIAEVARDVWDALRNGTGGTEPGANKSIVDALGFDGAAAVTSTAGMLRTAAGTTFVVKKTLTSSAVVQAGVDITAVSAGGDLIIDDMVIQTDATGLAAGTNFTVESNNTKGIAVFFSEAVANLGANKTETMGTGSVTAGDAFVLESGKKLIAKCTVADCTGAGTVDVYLICRRLADGASLAAA